MSAVLHEGQHIASLECPACGVPAAVAIGLAARLTVDGDGATLRAVLKQKGTPHICGQTELSLAAPAEAEAYSQPELDWAERAAGGRDDD